MPERDTFNSSMVQSQSSQSINGRGLAVTGVLFARARAHTHTHTHTHTLPPPNPHTDPHPHPPHPPIHTCTVMSHPHSAASHQTQTRFLCNTWAITADPTLRLASFLLSCGTAGLLAPFFRPGTFAMPAHLSLSLLLAFLPGTFL